MIALQPIDVRSRGTDRVLHSEFMVPSSIEVVFAFFSDVLNLDRITPPWLSFRVLTPIDSVREGLLIDYSLRIHGVPIRWQSEITQWEPPHRFVDVQRRGPYRRWIHEHTFRSVPGGTVISDFVTYAVPGGWIEPVVNRLIVRPDLSRIFAYRQEQISRLLTPLSDRGMSTAV